MAGRRCERRRAARGSKGEEGRRGGRHQTQKVVLDAILAVAIYRRRIYRRFDSLSRNIFAIRLCSKYRICKAMYEYCRWIPRMACRSGEPVTLGKNR